MCTSESCTTCFAFLGFVFSDGVSPGSLPHTHKHIPCTKGLRCVSWDYDLVRLPVLCFPPFDICLALS